MLIRSGYSFRNSTGKIPAVVSRLKELGYKHGAIADIASTWGFSDWRDECLEQGLEPVYAVTLAVSPNPSAKKPVSDYWTFCARSRIQSINELVALATSQFRYQPLLTYEQALAAKDCFIITGHNALFEHFEPQENLFIGLSPASAPGFIREAKKRCFSFCAMQNNQFVLEEDKGLWQVICGRGASIQTYSQHIIWFDDWLHNLPSDCGEITLEARQNWDMIEDACTGIKLPQASLPKINSPKTLREMCDKSKVIWSDIYQERLDTELQIIEDKNFEDYFFIVAELMTWARKEMLCGPGRGSSAGSLVSFLLGITAVDPIEHGLLFFRFIDPARPDMPDIDSDFDSEKRESIVDYLGTVYGIDHVSKIGAVALYQAKNSADEACKALGVPKYELEGALASMVTYAAGDKRTETALKESFETTSKGKSIIAKYPHIACAGDMGGNPRHHSTHAAGVVITDRPISEYVAIDTRSNTAQIEKGNAEKRGLLKLDILGLINLAIFRDSLELAGLPLDTLDKLTYDDQKVFDVLNDGKFTGTFQFEGHAVRNLTKDVKVKTLNDIAVISSLARPGPLSSGGASHWIRRKTGHEEVGYAHELLKPYLEETLGILVYQEQIMLIAREVAGMSWEAVAKLRKAIGKSQGAAMLEIHGEPFRSGLVKAGVPEDIAAHFWRSVVGFGAYGFNKSHAVAYAMVTYWSLWLKAYHPLEYASASLSHRTKVETQIELLRELAAEGVEYTPIDPEHSTDKWQVVNGRLIGPITLVKGLGPKLCQQVLSCRTRGEPLPDRAAKMLANPKTEIDELYPVEKAIEAIDLDALNIISKRTPCGEIKPNGEWQDDILAVGLVTVCEERDENDERRVQDRISRGQTGKYSGPTKFLELRVADSTGVVYYKIGRKDFVVMTRDLKIEAGKTLVAVKGTLCPQAPVVLCKRIKVIG